VNPNITKANPVASANGLADLVARHALWREQALAILVTVVMAVVASAVIGFALKATIGVRPGTDIERQGLDVTEHGEEGYIL
jgi:Amt family ammonium transporter